MVILKQVQAIVICAALTASGIAAQAPAGGTTQTMATGSAAPTFAELKQLAAPIALYPDELVGQVLAAATYPTEIVEAAQWLKQNSHLKGEQLAAAVDKQPWDPSVKGLSQFSTVLDNMAQNLAWTSALGEAYVNEPQNVMKAIQALRTEAKNAGNLKSTPQQNVTTEGQTIVIQPANPEVVYVPEYSPAVVYGTSYPAYPGYSGWDVAAASALSFGVGTAVGAALGGGYGWGWGHWGTNWHGGTVNFNRNAYVSHSNTFANRNVTGNYANRNLSNQNLANRNFSNQNLANRNLSNQNLSNRNFNAPGNKPGTMPANRSAGNFNSALSQANALSNREKMSPSASRGFGQAGSRSLGTSSNAFSGVRQGGSARFDGARGASSFASRGGGGGRSFGGGGGGRSFGGGGGRGGGRR
jgi:uncharacterized protein DUF3300